MGSFILSLALVLAVAACAGRAGIRWPIRAMDRPESYLLNAVPYFPQQAFQCGPAALAMALAWSGVGVSPQALVADVFTPSRQGSLQSAIIAGARRHGRVAYLLSEPEALIDEVAAGHPVVVLQNLGLAWYPVWHYAVVVGLDLAKGNVILHSGATPQKQLSFTTFEHTWARSDFWGLLVLPASRLPAVCNETDYLVALSNLERSGRWETAAEGYQTALNRWPDSLPATVGLGVCLYRTGDLQAAETVFRDAILKFVAEGVLFNNLAQVLMEQGRKTEALEAAMQAIECGGPLKAHFEKTLEEIRSQPTR